MRSFVNRIMRDTDDFLKEVQGSLADEVNEELRHGGRTVRRSDKKRMPDNRRKKRRKHKGLKIFFTVFLIFTITVAGLVFTPQGRRFLISAYMKYAYTMIHKTDLSNATKGSAQTLPAADPTKATLNVDLSQMSDTYKNARHEDGVFNILLLGVEAIGSSEAAGHTDSIMILTVNTKTRELGLTSLMRDTYVSVPGEQYFDGRINGVYRQGGMKLLYETVAANYDIRLDGCALVGFDAFQKVVDAMGGVNIKLTEQEAQYLNSTNYISKRRYRTMKAGWNHMNGNQALGYCRVRHIPTLGGVDNDQGRTLRHRRVIRALYKRLKKEPLKAVGVMNAVLPLVETDITENNASEYLAEILEMSLSGKKLDQLRLPEGEPDGTQYQYAKVNGADVLQITDWEGLKNDLANFIFSPHVSGKNSSTASFKKISSLN